jgi:hypothetical protein
VFTPHFQPVADEDVRTNFEIDPTPWEDMNAQSIDFFNSIPEIANPWDDIL